MFYLDKNKRYVIDDNGEVVGELKNGKFTQDTPRLARLYADGLFTSELEQLSEVIQRAPARNAK
jgi:hypothetical protein